MISICKTVPLFACTRRIPCTSDRAERRRDRRQFLDTLEVDGTDILSSSACARMAFRSRSSRCCSPAMSSRRSRRFLLAAPLPGRFLDPVSFLDLSVSRVALDLDGKLPRKVGCRGCFFSSRGAVRLVRNRVSIEKRARGVGADRKVDVLRKQPGDIGDLKRIELPHDHADNIPRQIHNRSPAVSHLYGRGDLDQSPVLPGACERAHDAFGDVALGGNDPWKGVPDDDDVLPRAYALSLAEFCNPEAASGRELEKREISRVVKGGDAGSRGVR